VRPPNPSDPAISRRDAPSGVCRFFLPEHNTPTRSMEMGIRQILILAREGILGSLSLFMSNQQSPYHRPARGERNGQTDLRPRQVRVTQNQTRESSLGDAMSLPRRAGRAAACGHLCDRYTIVNSISNVLSYRFPVTNKTMSGWYYT
jgi:hypothetical protein